MTNPQIPSGPTAVFGGTFDPVTNGHLDLIQRAVVLFPRVVVSVARAGRKTLFPIEERVELIREALEAAPTAPGEVLVEAFDGLVVEQARRHGATVLVRGIRGSQDWDYEMQMALANRGLAPEVDTLFLAPSPGMSLVSSSLVREVASLGGDVTPWVPPVVLAALGKRPPQPG